MQDGAGLLWPPGFGGWEGHGISGALCSLRTAGPVSWGDGAGQDHISESWSKSQDDECQWWGEEEYSFMTSSCCIPWVIWTLECTWIPHCLCRWSWEASIATGSVLSLRWRASDYRELVSATGLSWGKARMNSYCHVPPEIREPFHGHGAPQSIGTESKVLPDIYMDIWLGALDKQFTSLSLIVSIL